MAPHMGEHNDDPTIAALPLSDPRCDSDTCTAFYAAHNASQAEFPWSSQFEYGHWTTWYYLIFLFLFMLVYAHHLLQDRRSLVARAPSGRSSIANKALALIRSLSYRRFSGKNAISRCLPSYGVLAFIMAAVTFATAAAFAARPYYREHLGYGSPPLAIRTGLMATALTPIIVALSGKVNVVSMLTGIGHEKLNIVHRYVAWICFALSVAHTVPFIVQPLQEGGLSVLSENFYDADGLMV